MNEKLIERYVEKIKLHFSEEISDRHLKLIIEMIYMEGKIDYAKQTDKLIAQINQNGSNKENVSANL